MRRRGRLLAWFECRGGALEDYAFPSRIDHADHISTRQYARLVDEWVTGIGLCTDDCGTPCALTKRVGQFALGVQEQWMTRARAARSAPSWKP